MALKEVLNNCQPLLSGGAELTAENRHGGGAGAKAGLTVEHLCPRIPSRVPLSYANLRLYHLPHPCGGAPARRRSVGHALEEVSPL
jgi:hypothetical protein